MSLSEDRLRLLQCSLGEHDDQLRLALEAVGLGNWQWTPSTGEFLCSPRSRALQGLTASAPLTFEAFMSCVHAEDRDPMIGAMHEALYDASEFAWKYRAVHRDGSVRRLQGRGRVIRAGASGPALRIVGVLQQMRAGHPEPGSGEAAGRNELSVAARRIARIGPARPAFRHAWSLSSQLRNVADSAALAIVALDDGGAIRYANTAWQLLTGLHPEAVLQTPWLDTVHAGDRGPVAAALRAAVPCAEGLQFRQNCISGKARRQDARILALRDEFGRTQGHLIIATEARERAPGFRSAAPPPDRLRLFALHLERMRELERLELAASLQQAFQEELRQFSTRLLTMSGEAALPEAAREALKLLADQAEQLRNRLGDVVADLAPLGIEEPCLSAALRRYVEEQRECSGVEISLQVPTKLERVDRQVLAALYAVAREAVANAIEHARATRIEVIVQLRADQIRLRVSDDGVGIDDSERSKQGCFGLFAAGQRVEQMDGVLRIFGVPGSGTVVEAGVTLGHRERSAGDQRS